MLPAFFWVLIAIPNDGTCFPGPSDPVRTLSGVISIQNVINAVLESPFENLVVFNLRPKHSIKHERFSSLINSAVLIILDKYNIIFYFHYFSVFMVLVFFILFLKMALYWALEYG